ncbi:MAG: T9SS type A sorting domain-containing protein, partial [Vicingaceae bacterium]|nr:T9SS type A sorting domain-containing protein [Vicingaceae bacterium]
FMAVPLLTEAKFLEVTYAIDPAFIFTFGFTDYEFLSPNQLQIDFGDGNGFVPINPTIKNYITVQYPNNGEKTITTRIVNTEGSQVVKSSMSRFFIINNTIAKRPDEVIITLPGMHVGVYHACQNTGNVTGKSIILVEGFDFFDEIPSKRTGIGELYQNNIHNQQLQYLLNFGYDLYVVDWRDSKIDMRYNALNLLCLIEHLKSKSVDDQEFVIIGISMGGVIARFTLNFMESPEYQSLDFSPFFVENADPYNLLYIRQNPWILTKWQDFILDQLMVKNHNTRLLITIDSPHQGANVPLAYQNVFRYLQFSLLPLMPISPLISSIVPEFNLLQVLDKKATRQLLKWYAPIGSNIPPVMVYGPDPSHTSFYNQLRAYPNDGKPTYAKMVALADGALDGSRQQDPNTNLPRNYNDKILDFDMDLFVKVLWIPIHLLSATATLRTNPDNNRPIVSAFLGVTTIRVKIKMFGIKIKKVVVPVIPLINSYAIGTDPTCVTAGGHFDLFKRNNQPSIKSWNLWGGFLGVGVNMFNLESNGTGFCFVPLESALDYSGGQPYNNDILNEDINVKLASTPFDVMAGQVILARNNVTLAQNVWKNHEHTANRNDKDYVFNLTQQDAVGPTGLPAPNHSENEQYAYYTCAAIGNYEAKRTFLAQEIGDEELYLENFITNRTTSYRTEFDIKVNHRNPYYEYPSQMPSPPLILEGVYSKEADFDIAPGGFATFFVDVSSVSPLPSPMPGLSIAFLNSPDYVDRDEPYGICCSSASRFAPVLENKFTLTTTNTLQVYPNPAPFGAIQVEATLRYLATTAQLTVVSLTGKTLFTTQLAVTNQRINQHLALPHALPKGVYVLQLRTAKELSTTKLIIN